MRNLPTYLPTHPHWCVSRDQCADRKAHHGRLIEIRSTSGDYAPVTLQLVQALVGDPYIAVTGEAGHVVLSLRQARALAYAATVEARRASNPGNYPPRRHRPGGPR
jgi:hypothetical protein